jgi:hypothetical protein
MNGQPPRRRSGNLFLGILIVLGAAGWWGNVALAHPGAGFGQIVACSVVTVIALGLVLLLVAASRLERRSGGARVGPLVTDTTGPAKDASMLEGWPSDAEEDPRVEGDSAEGRLQ